MPIRFRCHHCNQLMGIARRKAGTMVQCPTCHAQVQVPQPEPDDKAPPAQQIPDAPAPLFERSDFEALLQNPVAENPIALSLPASSLPFATKAPSSFGTPSSQLRLRPSGLVLSPIQATWLTVGVIGLIALAFGAGLLVGYWMGG